MWYKTKNNRRNLHTNNTINTKLNNNDNKDTHSNTPPTQTPTIETKNIFSKFSNEELESYLSSLHHTGPNFGPDLPQFDFEENDQSNKWGKIANVILNPISKEYTQISNEHNFKLQTFTHNTTNPNTKQSNNDLSKYSQNIQTTSCLNINTPKLNSSSSKINECSCCTVPNMKTKGSYYSQKPELIPRRRATEIVANPVSRTQKMIHHCKSSSNVAEYSNLLKSKLRAKAKEINPITTVNEMELFKYLTINNLKQLHPIKEELSGDKSLNIPGLCVKARKIMKNLRKPIFTDHSLKNFIKFREQTQEVTKINKQRQKMLPHLVLPPEKRLQHKLSEPDLNIASECFNKYLTHAKSKCIKDKLTQYKKKAQLKTMLKKSSKRLTQSIAPLSKGAAEYRRKILADKLRNNYLTLAMDNISKNAVFSEINKNEIFYLPNDSKEKYLTEKENIRMLDKCRKSIL